MSTHNAEINDGAQPKALDSGTQALSAEIYTNPKEALQSQRLVMQANDTNGSVMQNFGEVVLFDSQAPKGGDYGVKNGETSKDAAENARKITYDSQGRPVEVGGHKVHYGPDGQIDKVDFPKGWNYDGGDTYVKGKDGKWRDTKHNRVKEDFAVSTSKDGTLTVTEGNYKGTETRIYHPDGSQTGVDVNRERNQTSVTTYDPSGRVRHEKITNTKTGEVLWDEDAKQVGTVVRDKKH